MHLHIYHHDDEETVKVLRNIEAMLRQIIQTQKQMEATLGGFATQITALEQAVAAENTVIGSAETLLTNLTTLLQQAIEGSQDPVVAARVQAVIDGINQQTTALSAAVTANTPAAPTPEPTPEPTPAPAANPNA